MTSFDSIVAEIKNSLKQYDTANLIDELSLIDWTFKALRPFGNLITVKNEAVVSIIDGKGVLPANFESLRYATLYDKGWVESELSTDELQKSYFWKERTEHTNDWNVCGDCVKNYSEKTIVEKIYLHNKETRFHYKNPRYLKLSRHTNKDAYMRGCQNTKIESPFEITINNKMLHTNFKEGEVFILYYGLELDEEGKPYIPQSPHERLENYLTYHLKRKIFETIWMNSDDTGIEGKIQYLLSQEQAQFTLALTDVKASTLTMKGFYNIEQMNKKRTAVFEY